ncbi:hypothetical protein HDU98_007208 [Podochytrium sp. JEL0797]|nr:hypothetical protein HDU98_007208 [Podochytrium sp. JEL0797]
MAPLTFLVIPLFLAPATLATLPTTAPNLIKFPNFENFCNTSVTSVAPCADLGAFFGGCIEGEFEGEPAFVTSSGKITAADLNPNNAPGGLFQIFHIPCGAKQLILYFTLYVKVCAGNSQATILIIITHISSGDIIFSGQFTIGGCGWQPTPLAVYVGKNHAGDGKLEIISQTPGSCGPVVSGVYLAVGAKYASRDMVEFDERDCTERRKRAYKIEEEEL